MKEWIELLKQKEACPEAIKWLSGQPSAEEAWQCCHRGDWTLWLAGHVDVDRRAFVKAACEIARTVLSLVPEGEDRPRIAIETVEAWCWGEATAEEVREATNAAYAANDAAIAAYAAYADAHVVAAYAAAADAAYAATYATYATYAASATAACAASAAAFTAVYVANTAAGAAAAHAAALTEKEVYLKQSAVIVRKHISYEMIAKAAGIGAKE